VPVKLSRILERIICVLEVDTNAQVCFLLMVDKEEISSDEAKKYWEVEITVLIKLKQCKSVFLCYKTL
jgi:hypothetical protein